MVEVLWYQRDQIACCLEPRAAAKLQLDTLLTGHRHGAQYMQRITPQKIANPDGGVRSMVLDTYKVIQDRAADPNVMRTFITPSQLTTRPAIS